MNTKTVKSECRISKPENILIWFGHDILCYHILQNTSVLASTKHKHWSTEEMCCKYKKNSSPNVELGKPSRVLHGSELPNGLRYSPTTQSAVI